MSAPLLEHLANGCNTSLENIDQRLFLYILLSRLSSQPHLLLYFYGTKSELEILHGQLQLICIILFGMKTRNVSVEEQTARQELLNSLDDKKLNDSQPPRFSQALILSGINEACDEMKRCIIDILKYRKISPEIDSRNSDYASLVPNNTMVIGIVHQPDNDKMHKPSQLNFQLYDHFGQSQILDGITLNPKSPTIHDIDAQGVIPSLSDEVQQELNDLYRFSNQVYMHPRLNIYICDILTAFRHHPRLSSHSLTARCSAQLVADWARIWAIVSSNQWSRVLNNTLPNVSNGHDNRLDGSDTETQSNRSTTSRTPSVRSITMSSIEVRPHHIKQIIPSLIRHRLHFRSRELSYFWGSDPSVLSQRHRMDPNLENIINNLLESL